MSSDEDFILPLRTSIDNQKCMVVFFIWFSIQLMYKYLKSNDHLKQVYYILVNDYLWIILFLLVYEKKTFV